MGKLQRLILLPAFQLLSILFRVSPVRTQPEQFVGDVFNDTAVQGLLDIILHEKNYDKRIRPRGFSSLSSIKFINFTSVGGATVVEIDLFVRSISEIDEMAMEFSTDLLVRQQWMDRRVSYNTTNKDDAYISGTIEVVNKIWKPDLFFANERKGYFHDITIPNTMLRMFPNGTLLYSTRYSITFSCQMHLEKFPFDTQRCIIQIGSFSLTEKSLVFVWKGSDPVTMSPNMKLPKFNLSHWTTRPCENRHYTGNFSCLRAEFVFTRELGYHLVQSFIPNFLLVMASWISFWLDVDAIPARVTLGVTTLLTTTAQGANIKDVLPPVSYTKAIDVWIGVCTFFVFAALVEFAIVNRMARKDMKKALSESKGGITPRSKYKSSSPIPTVHNHHKPTIQIHSPQHQLNNQNVILRKTTPGDKSPRAPLAALAEHEDCPDCGVPLIGTCIAGLGLKIFLRNGLGGGVWESPQSQLWVQVMQRSVLAHDGPNGQDRL